MHAGFCSVAFAITHATFVREHCNGTELHSLATALLTAAQKSCSRDLQRANHKRAKCTFLLLKI